LFVAGKLTIGRLHRARTPPGRRRCRCARRCPLECEPEPPDDVGGRDEAVGANHVAEKLAAGELWPAKVVAAVVSAGAEADQRGRPVSDSSERKMIFSFSRNVKIVLKLVNFITKLLVHDKIMKIDV
jgi:hypothetical protein